MCFHIDPNHPNKLVAESDIICYKAFCGSKDRMLKEKGIIYDDNYFYSIWMQYQYNKGQLYEVENAFQITFNSFTTRSNEIIETGFHSYIDPLEYNLMAWGIFGGYLVKCIIPVGAEYYINEKVGEYVSNKIIIGNDDDIVYKYNT